MSYYWPTVRSVKVLAFFSGWVQGLRDTDEALQEDGLFVWDLPLGDMGGSSTACPCSHNGDGLRESVTLA